MRHLGLVARIDQILANLRRYHYRPVLPAGAAERDRQVALAFADIMRQQINQKVGDAVHKLDRLRERPDISSYRRIAACQMFKPRNVIRVREKPDIEDQIAVIRDPVAESEAGHINHDVRFITSSAETLSNKLAEFVNG